MRFGIVFGPFAAVVFLTAYACRPADAVLEASHVHVAGSQATPLDAARFGTDPKTRRRILETSFSQVAARLGSLRFNARASFVLSRGGQEIEQSDVYEATADAYGDCYVKVETPESQVEAYQVGDAFYIRYDRGHSRKKPLRALDMEYWTELAFSSPKEALSVFSRHLTFADGPTGKYGGRPAVRFLLHYVSQEVDDLLGATAPVPAAPVLPSAPPSRWRELGRALDVRGVIVLDVATGAVLRAELDGRVEIADRDVRPTQLALRYESTVTEIGRVPRYNPPPSQDEFVRVKPPGDLLGFFRAHLPAEPDKP